MARKKKISNKAAKRQAEKELRAQWRQLEKLGLAKKRGKGEKLKLTTYKRRRIKQLAPVLAGKAQTVRLGPRALKAARENGIPLVGRTAIVPKRKSAVDAVKAGRKVKGIDSVGIDTASRVNVYDRALNNAERAIKSIPNKRPINYRTLEKQITKLGVEGQRALAKQRHDTYADWLYWWQQWAEAHDYDDQDGPFLYH